jgi:hypothetical protein
MSYCILDLLRLGKLSVMQFEKKYFVLQHEDLPKDSLFVPRCNIADSRSL